jgi:hypothetical protein
MFYQPNALEAPEKAMILNTTSRKLQVVLTTAATSANMSVLVDYTDTSGDSPVDDMQLSSTNGTTAVDICFAPANGVKRDINGVQIHNQDTASKIVRVSLVDNGTAFRLISATLQVGDTLGYTDATGWYVQDTSGNRRTNITAASNIILTDALKNNLNNGTAEATVSAVHYGDGLNMTAVLTLVNTPLTVGVSANLGVGALLYTLPAGACLVRDAYMSVGLSGVTITNDTPDVGLGTVIASGAIAVLGGTATFEDIITGQTAANTNGTATVKGSGPTAGAPLEITTAGAHTIYFNAADGWGANTDAAGLLNGTVVISYVRQAA